jgi:hypothetical protein
MDHEEVVRDWCLTSALFFFPLIGTIRSRARADAMKTKSLRKKFLLEQLNDVIENGKNDMARVRAIELAAEIGGIVQPASRKKDRFFPVENKRPAISSKDRKDLIERLTAYAEKEKEEIREETTEHLTAFNKKEELEKRAKIAG